MTKNQLIDEFNKMEQEIVIPYLKKFLIHWVQHVAYIT